MQLNPKILLPFISILMACGAPTKSAGDVASLFTGDARSLADKEQDLCGQIGQRDQAPTTKGMQISLSGCADAGKVALDYSKTQSFYFQGVDGAVPAKDQTDLIHKSARGEVWLNRSLLSLAASLSKFMHDRQANGDNTGAIQLPDSAKGQFSSLVTPTITVLDQPQLDLDNLAFSMKIHLQLTGAVKADHIIAIDGRLLGNAVAVTIKTTEDRTFDQSILKQFQAIIFIIPHAGDVYLDMLVDLDMYNVGLETLFKDQLNSFLGSGFKSVIDGVMQL